jgi:DNA-binding beta-propeller fold protein YncE
MSFFLNETGRAQLRLAGMGTAALVVAALIAGCGSEYHSVITPINGSGGKAQPTALIGVVSYTGSSNAGVATVLDYSGDTIMAQASIGQGPLTFSTDKSGSDGYTINSDSTVTDFAIATSLQTKNVVVSTLSPNAVPVNLFTPSAGMWIPNLTGNVVDVYTGSPLSYLQSISVAKSPIAVVGPALVGNQNFAISQNFTDSTGMLCNTQPHSLTIKGEVDAMAVTFHTVVSQLPVGVCPVYAVISSDNKRLFVLNRGSDTITVINADTNELDSCTPFTNPSGRTVTCHPTLPLSTTAGLTGANVPSVAGPVYAEYNAVSSQLIVADYDGNAVSVIDVSLDIYGNDSDTFGTTYTIPVGKNPASVTALYDGAYGNRAYTANQGDDTNGNGSVSVINLTSHTVEKKLTVTGHPRTVASIQNSAYGKVYVASPDSPYVTIIRTDQDIVDTTVLVEGNVVDVRVNGQNAGTAANSNVVSRRPGYGQPCNWPANHPITASTGSPSALDICRAIPGEDGYSLPQ